MGWGKAMRLGRVAKLSAMAAALLFACATIACHSFFSNTTSSHLAYITTSNGILAFRIDNKTGASTSIFTAPFVIGNSPAGIVVHPSNQFAYIANQLDDTISLLKIDSASGTLSEVMPRTQTGLGPGALALDQNGNFLFVAEQGSNDIRVFSVGTGGALSQVSTTPLGGPPIDLVMPLSGNFLYVTVPAFSDVFAFAVSSGALTPVPGSPFHISLGVATPGINQTGTFLYVPNPASGTISGFSVAANGALSQLITSPYIDCSGTCTTLPATPPVPVAAVVDSSGRFLYVANSSSGGSSTGLAQFSIDGSTGALTPLTATGPSAGTNPAFFVWDPDEKYLYVANVGSRSVSEFTMNSDGSLATTSNTIQTNSVPRGLALTH